MSRAVDLARCPCFADAILTTTRVRGNVTKLDWKKFPSSIDVARHAGVSQSAVSRTFAEKGSVSARTRARVLAAAAELGYQPSAIPRIMQTHRSFLVAIAIGGMYNPFNSSVLEDFTRRLQAAGYQVLLVHVEHGDTLQSFMPRLVSYRVDAVFLARGILDERAAVQLAAYKVPIVAFHTPLSNEWVSSVCCDNRAAGLQAAELFVRRAARRTAFIGGIPAGAATGERHAGFRERLLALAHPAPLSTGAPFTYEGGRAAAAELFRASAPPDAVFCSNDLIAIGCIDAARETGRRIPEDVMVIGFDDIPEAGWSGNSLTTFRQAELSMFDAALEVLRSFTEAEGSVVGTEITVPVLLTERQSTRRA
jgi:DNA-binding LacI/PurR family transcriptional regulator